MPSPGNYFVHIPIIQLLPFKCTFISNLMKNNTVAPLLGTCMEYKCSVEHLLDVRVLCSVIKHRKMDTFKI